MSLNTDQAAAFDAVKRGSNIFLTGPAGSGKSYLIRTIVDWANLNGKGVAVTALTGCAALLLGAKAKTLHSWAGVGLGREGVDALVTSINRNQAAKRRWKKTDMLVIDEISMLTPEFFEKLDVIGKRLRNSTAPWGGIQLILCGDFLQLPPVSRGLSGESVIPGRFAFESSAWKDANLLAVHLHKIERQTDPVFQQVLNECRIGAPSMETITVLKSRQGLDWKGNLIRPTLLFSRNSDVDSINEKNVAALKKPLRVYDAVTDIVPDPVDPTLEIPRGELLERIVTRLDNDANYCPHLELCEGCQVMLLVNLNIEKGLVNGSRGVVVGFRGDNVPIVQFLQGDPIAIEYNSWQSVESPVVCRRQIPLRVAYAITIHKSQGATLDCALVDIGSSTFEFGQAYVALSRVRSLESLYIHNLNPAKIMAHPAVVKFYEALHDAPSAVITEVVHAADTFGVDLSDDGWREQVTTWATSRVGIECLARVAEATTPVYPPANLRLEAIRKTPLSDVKVILLGQDPYHGEGQAHGLSFSVLPGSVMPPSLKNIRKELLTDLALPESVWLTTQGTLTHWAKQGVLLLNSSLTVAAGNPNSHSGMGWEELTQRLLGAVVARHSEEALVFLAWGKFAQTVVHRLKLGPKHKVLVAAHPSPLSAHNGYFGSKPFSQANAHLVANGKTPIEWVPLSVDVVEDPS